MRTPLLQTQLSIVIPSFRRPLRVRTLDAIPPAWRARTWLVVGADEADLYRRVTRHPQVLVHDGLVGIAAHRQFALDAAPTPWVLFLDDDLRFYVRRSYNPARLRDADNAAMGDLFATIEGLLRRYVPLVGVSSREGNNRVEESLAWNTRVGRAWAVNRLALNSIGFRLTSIRRRSRWRT
jgi:hypothetical protein